LSVDATKDSRVQIPFNKPYASGKELTYIAEAIASGHLSGDGRFSRRCQQLLEATLGSAKALLTHSCTAALEMAAILCDLEAGDEVIMPAFTFTSTANAVVLRGATPVFVDIRSDTLNLDEKLIEVAITSRTKAIIAVHYAGVGCEMDRIMDIARRCNLHVVEDAAQGILSRYNGRFLGTLGDIGTLSFHETKNVISGEGGAILINNQEYCERAEIIREKGTDRAKFFRGEISKYTWVDVGSSYLPGEIVAAYLLAQLEDIKELTRWRKEIWSRYHQAFERHEVAGLLRRPVVPVNCDHNGHLYYLELPDSAARTRLIDGLKARGIYAPFHYVPLHTSPAGLRFGRTHGRLPVTERAGECLVRLPIWIGMETHLDRIISDVSSIVSQ
jgi:dTDP-4-amino-4,6-dideoxygalactose transaminase